MSTPTDGAVAPAAVTDLAPQAATTPPTNEQAVTAPVTPAPEVIGIAPAAAPVGAEQDGASFTYQDTGDTGLDVALGFVGKLGFGPAHPAIIDAIDGKFEKLEAHLGTLGDKAAGWERMVGLAKDAYSRSATTTQQTQLAITAAVTEVAGGDKQWASIKEWAGKNADEAEKAEINVMLNGGPVQARAAANLLLGLYRAAGGTVVQPSNVIAGNAGNHTITGNGALSPADYFTAVRELRVELGARDLDSSPQYKALQARRSAWRG